MKYGSREVQLVYPEDIIRLCHREPESIIDPDRFRNLLADKLPLNGKSDLGVGIVVADKTRLCQYPLFLPVLTSYLLDAGVKQQDIVFYIAYGTHAPQSDEECLSSYGETYNLFRFVHHDSRAREGFLTLGTTSRGTRVSIPEELLQQDILISVGAILHHYFAGYGGGRKLFFPGLAAYDSILKNHSLFLNFDTRTLAPGCLSGELTTNPLALDLEEINGTLPERLELHAILNSRKEVCEIHAGRSYEDFKKVCRRYDEFFKSDEKEEFDLVVASAGGYPRDINFIQAHKSIHNAASFVKDGGNLVIFAECRDGIGNPDFMDMFKFGEWDTMFRELELGYRNNAGTALSMLEKSGRINIQMVTLLDKETCSLLGAHRCSPDEVQRMIQKEKGSVAILENAAMLYR